MTLSRILTNETQKIILTDGKEYTLSLLSMVDFLSYCEQEINQDAIVRVRSFAFLLSASLKENHPEITTDEAAKLFHLVDSARLRSKILEFNGVNVEGEASPVVN